MGNYQISKLNRVKRGANRASYDQKQIHDILDAGFIGHVGYIYDNTPISIPMAYARKKNNLFLHGSSANRMLKSILKAGKTSITVMHLDGLVLARSGFHHSVNYRSATVFGPVQNVSNGAAKVKILEMITEHMIEGRWPHLRKISEEELARTLVVEFTINTAVAKIRKEGVNDDPEDVNLPIWAGIVPIKQIALPAISDQHLDTTIHIPDHVTHYIRKHQ